jgi:pentatricopeptide repeat protein
VDKKVIDGSLEGCIELLSSISEQDSWQPDAETYALLLDMILSLPKQSVGNRLPLVASSLLEALVHSLQTEHLSSTEHLDWCFHKVMRRWIQDGQQTAPANELLHRWWNHWENQSPQNIIPPPTPEAYSIVMSGWAHEGEPERTLLLLQDLQTRDHVKPQVSHFETCLNAFLRATLNLRHSRGRHVGYDAESVLLQMTEWLDAQGDGLVGRRVPSASSVGTDRSYETTVLQNLNKVVQCWVDARHTEAPVRATSILHLMEEVFRESNKSPKDWQALVEAYSHAIRAWSFKATTRHPYRVATSAMDEVSAPQHAENLLVRLETFMDEGCDSAPEKQSTPLADIPVKVLRRAYGSAIAAYGNRNTKYCRKENALRARQLWDRFRERRYGHPGIGLYNQLFHVLGKMGDTQAAEQLWGELNNDDTCCPDLKSYNWMLLVYSKPTDAVAKWVNLEKARHLWSELLEKNYSPDGVSYSTFLSCFIGTRDMSTALEGDKVFRELLTRRSDAACRVSTVSLNAVLRMWANFASVSKHTSEREDALHHTLSILVEVRKLGSKGIYGVKPDTATRKALEVLFKASGLSPDKQSNVYRVLDDFPLQPTKP